MCHERWALHVVIKRNFFTLIVIKTRLTEQVTVRGGSVSECCLQVILSCLPRPCTHALCCQTNTQHSVTYHVLSHTHPSIHPHTHTHTRLSTHPHTCQLIIHTSTHPVTPVNWSILIFHICLHISYVELSRYCSYTVCTQYESKKYPLPKISAVFSHINLFNWKFSGLLSNYIHTRVQMFVHLSEYLYELYHCVSVTGVPGVYSCIEECVWVSVTGVPGIYSCIEECVCECERCTWRLQLHWGMCVCECDRCTWHLQLHWGMCVWVWKVYLAPTAA